MKKKTAIILFSLGGPDWPEDVYPFLKNMFSDKNIISLPQPFRFFTAVFLASLRKKPAGENYKLAGFRGDLLLNTKAQAEALEKALENSSFEAKCFVSMRYWHPFSFETLEEVKKFDPDEVVLLPLYPHYSFTTTKSSFEDWEKTCKKAGFKVKTQQIPSFFNDPDYIDCQAELIKEAVAEFEKEFPGQAYKLLFSAHGLPVKIIEKGDPYEAQIKICQELILQKLGPVENVLCYQSRATPQKWLKPGTDEEIIKAGQEGKAVIVIPLSFVSDHVETLVELDFEYRDLAFAHKVPFYLRVPVPGISPLFIKALVGLVEKTQN